MPVLQRHPLQRQPDPQRPHHLQDRGAYVAAGAGAHEQVGGRGF
jgi:hypothetical protein